MIINFELVLLAAASMDYEKSANIANVLFYVFLVLSLLSLALAVYSFFGFKIIKIINDLTGRTARKSIAKKRIENEMSGDKSFRPSNKAKERGRTTDKIRESEKIINKKAGSSATDSEPTDVLDNMNATQPLNFDDSKTEILSEGTQVLSGDKIQVAQNQSKSKIELVQNIIFINTEEVI